MAAAPNPATAHSKGRPARFALGKCERMNAIDTAPNAGAVLSLAIGLLYVTEHAVVAVNRTCGPRLRARES